MISLARLSVNMGRHYYTSDSYYTKDGAIENSEWFGKGAQYRNLSGHVDPDVFKKLLESHSQMSDKKPNQARVGLDLTFSAPKSVSLVGLVAGDKEVLQAHNEAVNTALKFVENRYSYTRVGSKDNRQIKITGNLCVAKFTHDLSRAKDPQLHTHCVALNSVKRNDGEWRSFHNDGVFNNSKLIGLIYQNELAHQIKKLGYQITANENGTFEIDGYTKEQIQEFSKRTEQINKLACKTKKQERIEKLLDRPAKGQSIPREVLMHSWQQASLDMQIKHPEPRINHKSEAVWKTHSTDIKANLSDAINHVTERDVKFKIEDLEKFILSQQLGKYSFHQEEYSTQINELIKTGDLIEYQKGCFTTKDCLEREKSIIDAVKFGQGKFQSISAQVPDHISENFAGMTSGQKNALISTLTSKDQFIAWQGVAGAGKTFAMNLVREECINNGFVLKGFSVSKDAANVLEQESGIRSNTVASLLVNQNHTGRSPIAHNNRELWIIDEASLLGAKDCEKLLQIATNQNARIIFVGDTKQLSSIQAGNPFSLIQQAGIKTAHLTESRRQKTHDLKRAVDCIANNHVQDGLTHIQDHVFEVSGIDKKAARISNEYLNLSQDKRDKTLILSSSNHERAQISKKIREELTRKGELTNSVTIHQLAPKYRTEAEVKSVINYQVNDVLIFHRAHPSLDFEKDVQYSVQSIDQNTNEVFVQNEHDPLKRTIKLSKNLGGFTLFTKTTINIAEGDRIKCTKNNSSLELRNGQSFRVEKTNTDSITLRSEQGKLLSLSTKQAQHIDYNYVHTVYSSQGKTCDKVIISDNGSFGKEMLYVALSRAKHQISVFTDNKTQFLKSEHKSKEKMSAINLTKEVKSHVSLSQLKNQRVSKGVSNRML